MTDELLVEVNVLRATNAHLLEWGNAMERRWSEAESKLALCDADLREYQNLAREQAEHLAQTKEYWSEAHVARVVAEARTIELEAHLRRILAIACDGGEKPVRALDDIEAAARAALTPSEKEDQT